MKTLAGIALSLSIIGCAAPPTAQEVASADYGPFPSQYQADITAYMERQLRDPESARYEFSMTPVKAWYGMSSTKVFGWAVCAHINAKNGFGGYAGQKKSYFFMKHGSILESRHSGESGGVEEAIVYGMCSKL